MQRKLLVVDDDEVACRLLDAVFTPEGFDVTAEYTAKSGLEAIAEQHPDVVLLDLKLPDLDGLEVLERVKRDYPDLPVIMFTGHADVTTAVRAMELGAFDFRTKPINPDDITFVVRRALETHALQREVGELRQQLIAGSALRDQMGHSPEVRKLVEQVDLVSESTFTVLVTGETGTGKELIAQAIHKQSPRRAKPFIALDCGAIPENLLESELFGHEKGAFTGATSRKEGRFQLAEGGTLFLDEVGNLPLGLQAKLLRVLESREVQSLGSTRASAMDVRFVAATNHNLTESVAAGHFRADLYFRLAQYTIPLPPLRDRAPDIGYLAVRFLEEASIELRRPVRQLSLDAITVLNQYAWPGNVRELRNVIRRTVLQSRDYSVSGEVVRDVIGRAKSAEPADRGSICERSLKQIALDAARAAERLAICEALRLAGGNKSRAARALKTDYKTLHLKMRQFGIRAREFAP